tara:strand:+ start:315 stop:1058 length:744 start_codon:yes stop_codon:yes gene_type:complete
MEYICPKCKKHFRFKSTYERHLNIKGSCVKEDSLKCPICGKVFANRQSKFRHMKSQKCLKDLESETKLVKKQYTQIKKTLDTLTGQINKTKSNGGDININQINNINNVVININNFGNENMSHITDKMLKRLIQKPEVAVPELLKEIHFNPNYPENKNIRITNKKEKYAQVFLEQQWLLTTKSDILNQMVDKGVDILDNCFEENYDDLSNFKRSNFEKFQSYMEDDLSKGRKRVCKDTELLVLNNSKE